MEKVKNPYYKAVSIISFVFAIIFSVSLGIILVASLLDVEYFISFFEPIIMEDGYGNTELVMDMQTSAIAMLVIMSIYMGGLVAFLFVAYAKLKKYTELTNEEAKVYSGRLIAWIVVMFLFGGMIMGLLMVVGYITITEKQISALNLTDVSVVNSVKEVKEENNTKTQDLDLMIVRLEKLQRIKEMGGLTDEEYENLRQAIVNGK